MSSTSSSSSSSSSSPQFHSIDTLPPVVCSFLRRLGLTTTTAFLAADSAMIASKCIDSVLMRYQHGGRGMTNNHDDRNKKDDLASSSFSAGTSTTVSTFPSSPETETATTAKKTMISVQDAIKIVHGWKTHVVTSMERRHGRKIKIRLQQQERGRRQQPQQQQQKPNLRNLVLRQQQILHQPRLELLEQQRQRQSQQQQQDLHPLQQIPEQQRNVQHLQDPLEQRQQHHYRQQLKQQQLIETQHLQEQHLMIEQQNSQRSSSICCSSRTSDACAGGNIVNSIRARDDNNNNVTEHPKLLPLKKRLKFDTATTATNFGEKGAVATATTTDDRHRHRRFSVQNLYHEQEERSNFHLRIEPLATKNLLSRPLGIHLDMSSTGDFSKDSAVVIVEPNKNGIRGWICKDGAVAIVEPNKNDVLNGRGGESNNHPGNITYRSLVRRCREFYRTRPKHTKMMVARSIVRTIANLDEPGRFMDAVKTSDGGKVWRKQSDRRAVDKVSQALREPYTPVPEDEIFLQAMESVAITRPERKEASVEIAVRAVALIELATGYATTSGSAAIVTQPNSSSTISTARSHPSQLQPSSDGNGSSNTPKSASSDDSTEENENPSENSDETSNPSSALAIVAADSNKTEDKVCPRFVSLRLSLGKKKNSNNESFGSPAQVQKRRCKMKSLSMKGRKRAASSTFVNNNNNHDDDDIAKSTTDTTTTNASNSNNDIRQVSPSDTWFQNWR